MALNNVHNTWLDRWNNSSFWLDAQPSVHFRTPATTCPSVLGAWVDALLDTHHLDHLVEVGAGDAPATARVRRHAIDLRPVPGVATIRARWREGWDCDVAALWDDGKPVLLLAVEWLDDLPCPVVVREGHGWVHLGPWGRTRQVADPADAAWLQSWWPAGGSADVGRPRDEAWAWFARRLPPGSVLACVDYGHAAADRPASSTLAAHRHGRAVPPGTPDANLTAHVAVDSLAAAVEDAGAVRLGAGTLADLDIDLPVREGLPGLALRSELAAWRAPHHFGGFRWLTHRVGHNGPHA